MKARRAWRKAVLALVLMVLVAGGVAPFLRADRWAPRIRESLEHSLHRKVEVGQVHLNLFTGPGFSVDNVVIHEDRSFGVEPVAYVSQLDARIRVWALLRGRLEFSNLRLEEPSVNLARMSEGRWNLQQMIVPSRSPSTRGERVPLPAIQVRSGRVNFKIGDLKSVFYLSNADVDVYPTDGGATLRFSGEPARTDRGAQGFGRWSGRGEWRAAPGGGQMALDLELKRSAIGEIVRLVYGHDVGFHGFAASRARVTGRLSDLQIAGRLHIEDIHRWDLMPSKGEGWAIDYRGRLDFLGQELELATTPQGARTAPIEARVRVTNLFSVPRWGSAVTARLPLGPVAEVARHFGAGLPGDLRVEGGIEGVVGISKTAGVQGRFAITKAALRFPSGVALGVPRAVVIVDGGRLSVRPVEVRLPRERTAQMEAEYEVAAQRLVVTVAARSLPTQALRDLDVLLAAPPVPFLEACKEGLWKGWLRYQREGQTAGRWSAGGELLKTKLVVPGLAVPVEMESATLQLDGDRLGLARIRATAGGIEFGGEYGYEPKAARAHQFRFTAREVQLAALETLFAPTLDHRQGFLARTLRWRRPPAPEWLRTRRAEGTVSIRTIESPFGRLERFRTRLLWDGARIDVPELTSRWNDGVLSAKGRVTLASSSPRYEADATLRGAAWQGGTLDAALKLQSEGMGLDLLANLKSSGSVTAHSLPVPAEGGCRRMSAKYEFSGRRGVPRLRFTSVEMAYGDVIYQGKGGVHADGRVEFDLASGEKELRLAGTLMPFQVEAIPPAQKEAQKQ